jgi:hypothetical protein
VLLALNTKAEDLNSVYRVIKHNLEIEYVPLSCPVVSTKMRGKSQGGRKRVEGEINIDLNSNSAFDADFTELNFGKPRYAI